MIPGTWQCSGRGMHSPDLLVDQAQKAADLLGRACRDLADGYVQVGPICPAETSADPHMPLVVLYATLSYEICSRGDYRADAARRRSLSFADAAFGYRRHVASKRKDWSQVLRTPNPTWKDCTGSAPSKLR